MNSLWTYRNSCLQWSDKSKSEKIFKTVKENSMQYSSVCNTTELLLKRFRDFPTKVWSFSIYVEHVWTYAHDHCSFELVIVCLLRQSSFNVDVFKVWHTVLFCRSFPLFTNLKREAQKPKKSLINNLLHYKKNYQMETINSLEVNCHWFLNRWCKSRTKMNPIYLSLIYAKRWRHALHSGSTDRRVDPIQSYCVCTEI